MFYRYSIFNFKKDTAIFISFFLNIFCFLENVAPLDNSLTQDYEISDYCSDDPCDKNASCMETVGAFTCTCNQGFIGNGLECEINTFEDDF